MRTVKEKSMVNILAPMSGNIWKILVNPGDSVNEDDELIVMEAMKMEIPVTAPQKGTIDQIHVQQGDSVEADAILVTLS
ncbi:MAG: acetyl-CoA carboxylase biotin carboxyl carrier protein subunit [Deltaproteobacteria bacterium]|nr:acetyl-CoA carboxylase biotin carboxyl carrier protein subunit [Deltaproteobacteria bacterium]